MILCSHCGTEAGFDQSFCLECGRPLSLANHAQPAQNFYPAFQQAGIETPAPTAPFAPPYTQATQPAPRSMTAPLVIVGLLAVAAISVAVTVFLLKSRSGDDAQNAHQAPAVSSSTPNSTSWSGTTFSSGGTQVRITATASSTRPPMNGSSYEASNVLDGSLLTAWVEGVSGPGVGQWIRCDFEREITLRAIRITPGYFKSPQLWTHNNRLAAATFYFSDGSSRHFNFQDVMTEQRLNIGGVRTRWVRMTIDDFYAGTTDGEDTPISEIAFEWEP
ncbi:MAG TPA: discoidin domain-containing protein [Pyrinomonadaceae bacterium]|nr:discoidin domain-containing protein [Pyrinomonadaceae bacterium]